MPDITYQNKNLHYEISGSGPAVVLLHGFGEDEGVWAFQKVGLEKDFQILLPQLPGTGRSELLNDTTMESMADAVHAILEKEQIEKCVMIGHSMGGYVTLAFAEKFPEKLSAFGLFHSSAFADDEEKIASRKKGIDLIQKNGGAAFVKSTAPDLFSDKTKSIKPDVVAKHAEAANKFSAASLIAYYEAMMQRPDRTEILKETKLPVLFVMGRSDRAVPMEDSLKQTHLPETSHVHILEDSGHQGMLEEPEKSLSILQAFLKLTATAA